LHGEDISGVRDKVAVHPLLQSEGVGTHLSVGVFGAAHQIQAAFSQSVFSVYAEGVVQIGAAILQLFETESHDVPEGQAHVLVASHIFPPEHFVSSGLHHQPANPEQVRTPHAPQFEGGELS